jgi:hypothetical protein
VKITLRDIKEAVENTLSVSFPSITIYRGNIIKSFPRPSFHTQIDNVSRNDRLYVSERGMTITIHYFPPDRYQYEFDIMSIQESLEATFKLNFKVKDRTFTIEEIHSQVVDGVLEFEFNFSFSEANEGEEQGDLMTDLELKV